MRPGATMGLVVAALAALLGSDTRVARGGSGGAPERRLVVYVSAQDDGALRAVDLDSGEVRTIPAYAPAEPASTRRPAPSYLRAYPGGGLYAQWGDDLAVFSAATRQWTLWNRLGTGALKGAGWALPVGEAGAFVFTRSDDTAWYANNGKTRQIAADVHRVLAPAADGCVVALGKDWDVRQVRLRDGQGTVVYRLDPADELARYSARGGDLAVLRQGQIVVQGKSGVVRRYALPEPDGRYGYVAWLDDRTVLFTQNAGVATVVWAMDARTGRASRRAMLAGWVPDVVPWSVPRREFETLPYPTGPMVSP